VIDPEIDHEFDVRRRLNFIDLGYQLGRPPPLRLVIDPVGGGMQMLPKLTTLPPFVNEQGA
jgi:hypothetical protein